MSSAVSNRITQTSLWETAPGGQDDEFFQLTLDPDSHYIGSLRFPCADDSKDPEWTRHMLRSVTGQKHYWLDYLKSADGKHTVCRYADILSAWIADDGVVTATARVYLAGRAVERLRAGLAQAPEDEEDEL